MVSEHRKSEGVIDLRLDVARDPRRRTLAPTITRAINSGDVSSKLKECKLHFLRNESLLKFVLKEHFSIVEMQFSVNNTLLELKGLR